MMYQYKVLGIHRLDFVTDQGDRINGVQLWVATRTADKNWICGAEVFKIWIEYGAPLFDSVMNLRPGMEISGECDRKGRPLSIEICG